MDNLKKLKQQLIAARNAVNGGDMSSAEMFILSASKIVDKLTQQAKLPAASQLGSLGGAVTARRGSDYFRDLAARRKTHGGGRPRKEPE